MNELENRAKVHSEKQHGLSPFCSLSEEECLVEKKKKSFDAVNTDAGNVEYNIAMFNKMNSPVDGPSTNAVSGPMGEAVEADILYVIKDKFGNTISAPTTDRQHLSSRVQTMTENGINGIEIVEYEDSSALTESINKGDRVKMDMPSKMNYGSKGTCTGKIGELCWVEWDDGSKSTEIQGFLSSINEDNLTEGMKSFYIDEIVPAAGGKTTTERHSFDTLEDLKNYVKESNLKADDIESIGGCEISALFESATASDEMVELTYPKLEFTQCGAMRDADDWNECNRKETWDYQVPKEELYTFIFERIDIEDFPIAFDSNFNPNDPADWSLFTSWLDDNFTEIYEKYEREILDHWEMSAKEDASMNYNIDDYVDWDVMPGGHDDIELESLTEDSNTDESDKHSTDAKKNEIAKLFEDMRKEYGELIVDAKNADKILEACGQKPQGKKAKFDDLLRTSQEFLVKTPSAVTAFTKLFEFIFDAVLGLMTIGLIAIPFDAGNAGEVIAGLITLIPITKIVEAVTTVGTAIASNLITCVRKSLRESDVKKVEQAAVAAGVELPDDEKVNEEIDDDFYDFSSFEDDSEVRRLNTLYTGA